jgi:N6-L-threonylcarbamoyladenine synthase
MNVLGIESSCDETGVAIVQDGTKVLANALASSLDLHAKYGGVVPEIAARSHIEAMVPLIDEVFKKASSGNGNWVIGNGVKPAASPVPSSQSPSPISWNEIDAIAVTTGAGLMGSLLIGVLTARTLAITKQKPLYAINHVEAHVYANFLVKPAPKFPLLSLIVSGGHTQLVYFKNHFDYRVLGRTTDDAVGETFDKVARILGLAYPGGPSVAKAALQGDSNAYQLPKAKLNEPYNFSFSGLKTAVLRLAQEVAGKDFRTPSIEIPKLLNDRQKNDIAASFQRIAIETLIDKTKLAYEEYKPKTVVIAGGVAASQPLRQALSDALPIKVTYAPGEFCTDNGAMVAALGCFKMQKGIEPDGPYTLAVDPNLKM